MLEDNLAQDFLTDTYDDDPVEAFFQWVDDTWDRYDHTITFVINGLEKPLDVYSPLIRFFVGAIDQWCRENNIENHSRTSLNSIGKYTDHYRDRIQKGCFERFRDTTPDDLYSEFLERFSKLCKLKEDLPVGATIFIIVDDDDPLEANIEERQVRGYTVGMDIKTGRGRTHYTKCYLSETDAKAALKALAQERVQAIEEKFGIEKSLKEELAEKSKRIRHLEEEVGSLKWEVYDFRNVEKDLQDAKHEMEDAEYWTEHWKKKFEHERDQSMWAYKERDEYRRERDKWKEAYDTLSGAVRNSGISSYSERMIEAYYEELEEDEE